MKKKMFILVLVFVLVSMMVCCGNKNSKDKNNPDKGDETQVSEELDEKDETSHDKEAQNPVKDEAGDKDDSLANDSNNNNDSSSGVNKQDDNTIELPILPMN